MFLVFQKKSYLTFCTKVNQHEHLEDKNQVQQAAFVFYCYIFSFENCLICSNMQIKGPNNIGFDLTFKNE